MGAAEMSYCRVNGTDSDVYMYPINHGEQIVCCGCRFCEGEETEIEFDTPLAALAHLHKHIETGDKVPQRAIDRLAEQVTLVSDPELERIIQIIRENTGWWNGWAVGEEDVMKSCRKAALAILKREPDVSD